jgi:hypothetical protein
VGRSDGAEGDGHCTTGASRMFLHDHARGE